MPNKLKEVIIAGIMFVVGFIVLKIFENYPEYSDWGQVGWIPIIIGAIIVGIIIKDNIR